MTTERVAAPPPATTEPLLTVRDLRSYLATGHGVVRAVDGVSLTVHEAEIVGIVGESGCGKTVTCRTIIGLMPAKTLHASGEVIYHPHGDQNILGASPAELQELRGSHLAMIFQDPMTALNPVRTIGDQLLEAVTAHAKLTRPEAKARAIELLNRVGIPAPARRMRDYPFQFSGGMLQRALIAIALASSPRLLLADEPTTSLDVIIQDQILSLLVELQQDTGMSMILISHDLAVVTEVCDRVVVMYAGQIVEAGTTTDVVANPRHPYTQALLDALPRDEQQGELRNIPGAPPSLIDIPAGCRFAPRCPYQVAQCLTWDSELIPAGGSGGSAPRADAATGEAEHAARCWRQDDLGKAAE